MSTKLLKIDHLKQLHASGAGYDMIRYIGLPDILGKERDTMLYFMGKSLARKFEIETLEDIYSIFSILGWGRLELVKEKKKQLTFHLLDDSIVLRLKGPLDVDFRLEAGFLAEAVQRITERECECQEEIHKRIHQVKFDCFYIE